MGVQVSLVSCVPSGGTNSPALSGVATTVVANVVNVDVDGTTVKVNGSDRLTVDACEVIKLATTGAATASTASDKFAGVDSTGACVIRTISAGGSPASSVVAETAYSQATVVGVSALYARGDHSHGTPALPTPAGIGAATSGHVHPDGTTSAAGFLSTADKTKLDGVATGATANTPATTIVSETAFAQAAVVGVGVLYARNDHTHGTPAAPTPAEIGAATISHQATHQTGGSDALTGLLDATARGRLSKAGTLVASRRELNLIEGTNVTITAADNSGAERVDVTITAAGGSPAVSVVAETAYNQVSAVGTGTNYARQDHSHGTPALPTPAAIGASATGHVHTDGTTTVAGFISTADKTKLDGIAAGATATVAASSVASETAFGQATVVGVATVYARGDHSHGTPTAPTPAGIGAASTAHQATHQSGGSDALSGLLDATARCRVSKAGVLVGTRREVNFLDGANVTVTAVDNPGAERVDVSIATSGAAGAYTTVIATADVVNNNAVANTLQDVTGLVFPVTSGFRYFFTIMIPYTAAATTTGSRWVLTGPTFTRLSFVSRSALNATTQTETYGSAYNIPALASSTSNLAGNIASFEGFITPSASGSVQIRFASEVASSAITALAGAFIEYRTV